MKNVLLNLVPRSFIPALLAMGVFLPAATAKADLVPGGLVVARVGDGSGALSSSATPVFLDLFLTNGNSGGATIALPKAATQPTGNPFNLLASGSAGSEGNLTISPDGSCILIPGYNGIPGQASIKGTQPSAVGRTIGLLSAAGSVDTSRSLNMLGNDNYRSVTSSNGTTFWAAGQNGVSYVAANNAVTSLTAGNTRVMRIFGGQLFYSTSSGTAGIYTLGTGLPVSGSPSSTLVINTGGSPYNYEFNAASNICYITDDSAGIKKYTRSGSAWSLAYTISISPGAYGLAVDWSGANPILYATTSEASNNKLIRIVDTGSGSTPTTLATAGVNKWYRAIAFNPTCTSLVAGPISGSSSICANSTGVTYTIASVAGATGYTWTVPPGATITLGQNTPSITVTLGAASGDVTVSALNACGSGTSSTLAVTVNGTPSSTITAAATVCPGSTGNTASVPDPGITTTYAWTITGGTITSASNIRQITYTAPASGSISLGCTVTTTCGSSTGGTTVNLGSPDATVTAPAAVCASSTGNTASVPDGGSGAGYVWTITGGSITSTSNIRQIAFTANASGTVHLQCVITSGAGCTATGTFDSTIVAPPSSTIIKSAGVDTVGSQDQFQAPSGSGLGYAWSLTANTSGAAINGAANAQTVTVDNGAATGNYTINLTVQNSTGCSSSSSSIITITNPPSPFAGFVNQGLVGVGRISHKTLDALGQDSLGGLFSSMHFDLGSWTRTGVAASGYTYSGTLYALPDRGYNNGLEDYHERIQTLKLAITPWYGGATNQTEVVMSNTATLILKDNTDTVFTGLDSDDTTSQTFPRASSNHHRSLDSEGIVRLSDGSSYICDEYGPFIYYFDTTGKMVRTLPVPQALIPKGSGSYPRPNNFTGASDPSTSGRYGNRGLEGLSISPDRTRLFAMLQSPLVQDGNVKAQSYNTRILVYDVQTGSPTFEQLVGEYVYQLSHNGNSGHTKNTPISEIHVLNNHQLLILERDGIGVGGDAGASLYKKVNLADLTGASNIAGTGYDLEVGASGQLSLPANGMPAGLTSVSRQDFVDLLDTAQLSKFGLNKNGTTSDTNSLCEKWEGLGLMPLNDSAAPNDFLLLVGNDNDFLTQHIFQNGLEIAQNVNTQIDNMILVFRVTVPNSGGPVTANAQSVFTPHDTPVAITLTGTASSPVYTMVTNPLHGTLSGTAPNLTYTPSAGYIGTDSFTFNVNDGINVSFPATVTVIVDDPPVPSGYLMGCPINSSNTLSVAKLLKVTTDPNADTFNVTAVNGSSAHGAVVTLNNGIIKYVAPLNFSGTDTFTYTLQDGPGATSQGTVTVIVTTSGGSGQSVTGVSINAGQATIHFIGIPNLTYNIDASTNLVNWLNIGTASSGSDGTYQFVDPNAGQFTTRYYRSRYP